ncbi:hypothetical protein ACFE04_005499 [Oxalis oulophora]
MTTTTSMILQVAPSPSPSPSTLNRLSYFTSARNRFVVRSKVEPTDKSVEIMRKFSEQYARKSGTYFCVDKGVTSVVIKGLADHKDHLGAPLCPCRHYDDKAAEVSQGFWNCPCVPMRERKECHCMLFLTSDNDFAGTDQMELIHQDYYPSLIAHETRLLEVPRGYWRAAYQKSLEFTNSR